MSIIISVSYLPLETDKNDEPEHKEHQKLAMPKAGC